MPFGIAIFQVNIFAFDITALSQALLERCEVRLIAAADEHDTNTRNFRRGLRFRPARQTQAREQNDASGGYSEMLHLITRSALASTFGGIVRPICLAAFRLMTNSNLVGASIGRSAGLAPFRILSTYTAARRTRWS